MKENIKNLKADIKMLANDQVELRNERKTVNFKGKRKYGSAYKATMLHLRNRWNLMHMYIAYDILRGKDPVYPTKKEYSQTLIDRLLTNKMYKPRKECVTELDIGDISISSAEGQGIMPLSSNA